MHSKNLYAYDPKIKREYIKENREISITSFDDYKRFAQTV